MNLNDIKIDYQFTSQFGDIEGDRFITEYSGEVILTEENSVKRKKIGRFTFSHILVELAQSYGYDEFTLMDQTAFLFEIGRQVFDFDTRNLKEDINESFGRTMFTNDFCIIEDIELLAPYRTFDVRKHIIKDIYNRFMGSCSLFVAYQYPIQFYKKDWWKEKESEEWYKQLQLDSLEQNFDKAVYELKTFYSEIGFIEIKGYDNLMFSCPYVVNKKLDQLQQNYYIK